MLRKITVLVALLSSYAFATVLSGTFQLPNGSGASGVLYLQLAQQAAVSTSTIPNTSTPCGGPIQLLPSTPVTVIFTAGVITGGTAFSGGATATIFGTDCLLPQNVAYQVKFLDNQGNAIFSDLWSITGATENIGTIVSTTITGTTTFLGQNGVLLTSPTSSQTVTQQPSTTLNVNYLDVTSTLTGPGGISCTGTGCVFGAPLAAPDGLTAAGPTSITIGGGNIYGHVYSGGDANCTGIADGWFGFRADTKQLQVCLSGQMYQSVLTLP
jgi:hypothetical protein